MNIQILAKYWKVKPSIIEQCLKITAQKHDVTEFEVYKAVSKVGLKLPYELYFHLIETLPIQDILNLCSTSKEMGELCQDTHIWSYLIKRDFGIRSSQDPKKEYILYHKERLLIACGNSYTTVITKGDLYTWGENQYGQLGNGTTKDSKIPIRIDLPSKPLQVACGNHHTAVITEDGLYTWGQNLDGQLGDGTKTNSKVPIFISTLGL